MKLNEKEYQCDACQGIFQFGWTDEEAEQEAKKNFGEKAMEADMAIICDDCYKQMVPTIFN